MKKLLSIFLAIVLIITAMSLGAFEFKANALSEGDYTYSVSDGKATITDVDTSISGAVTIPSTLGGYPVTSIGSYAFSDCTSFTSITIPLDFYRYSATCDQSFYMSLFPFFR